MDDESRPWLLTSISNKTHGKNLDKKCLDQSVMNLGFLTTLHVAKNHSNGHILSVNEQSECDITFSLLNRTNYNNFLSAKDDGTLSSKTRVSNCHFPRSSNNCF